MKKSILLNGAVRDVEEFFLIIDYILHKKSIYNSDAEVIVSTWHDDISANLPFFSWMMEHEVRVIGSASIDKGGPANVFRQWRTLDAGLSALDSDRIILKGRTDKFLARKDVIDAFLRMPEDSPQLMQLAHSKKLAIEHVSLSLPFMAKDMIYLGSAVAIRQIVHYSVRTRYCADHIFNGIGPECFLWLEFCSDVHEVMIAIQKIDLRQVSNKLTSNGNVTRFDWSQLPPHLLQLYRYWIRVFDDNLLFLTDVLDCTPVPSWIIDEGSWRYQVGDRTEFDFLKKQLEQLPKVMQTELDKAPYLNSVREYSTTDGVVGVVPTVFNEFIELIRHSMERTYSDIVLLRKFIIEQELGKSAPDREKLSKALHWNIRQRDRSTLKMVYDWMMTNAPECRSVKDADKVFTIERMVDLFVFAENRAAIEKTIQTIPQFFKSTALLRARVAEYHFTKGHRLRALYWFILSYWLDSRGGGVNHGLGCTLLDLGFPRLALTYLRKAHSAMPADQTAIFTLIRALHAIRKSSEAHTLTQAITGNLRIEAERILRA
jgi:hypothetical protein